ncbi:uncharacterized protein ACA1_045970 [Acanthamoeba castellanii str. Neff]|uniref:PH domain containing protein n=1 Tax=Acanthamoeba castellanii (strain ATCC 30010 / Neff) TaxID=1257118 RepID=L8H8P9_ACACF|nr:uncharacterized protein ACA1_045970 [Acanthamoeba castellanii str. Neff]ELR21899.1 hypothetical protein ACA1_045970 [Acanthamoeba castellanii str. Neff]
MEATKDAWRSLTDKWSATSGGAKHDQLLDFDMPSTASSSLPSASSSSSSHHQSSLSSFSSPSSPLSSSSSSLFSTISQTLKKSTTAVKMAAATATSAVVSPYERASIVEGDVTKAGHVISVMGWQAVWPGINLLELTTTGLRLLSEEKRVKSDMRIAAVEAVGVDERNPLQFFVRGKAPAVTWSLECRSASDAAAWVAAIQEAIEANHYGVGLGGDDDPFGSSQSRRSRAATAPPAPLFRTTAASPHDLSLHHHHHNGTTSQATPSLFSIDEPLASGVGDAELGPLGVVPLSQPPAAIDSAASDGGLLLGLGGGGSGKEPHRHNGGVAETGLIKIALPSRARRPRANTYAAPHTALTSPPRLRSPSISRAPLASPGASSPTAAAAEAAWDPFGDAFARKLPTSPAPPSSSPSPSSSSSSGQTLPVVPSPASPTPAQETFNFLD